MKKFLLDRKKELAENGLFFCFFMWFFMFLLFILIFPFWLIGFFFSWLNDLTKSWFGGVTNE